ncbi:MAG TPA: hypothetical protein VKA70_16155 [Blastocatellia bacterium]|nr:hypothetical protein [Blastocatellia bacterium]
MEHIAKLEQEVASLDERIEAQVRLVSNKLARTQKIEELEDCAAELTRLIDRRKIKHDLLILLTAGDGGQSRGAVGRDKVNH